MQCYWEQIGILGPTYRLLGRGWSNQDIAKHLGRPKDLVDNCVEFLLRFLKRTTREELVFVLETERMNTRTFRGIESVNWRIAS